MTPNDFHKFADEWVFAHDIAANKSVPSERAVSFVFELLIDYPLEFIIAAIKQHCKTNRFAPTPSDIVSLLETKNKRPSADEAWAIIPKDDAYGYEKTVVWTQEIAQGWAKVCQDYQTDRVGARMAFKAIYERLCNEAVLMGKPVEWILAIGTDKAQQKAIIERGIAEGKLIATPTLKEKLLALEPPKQTVAGLIKKSAGNVINAQKWKMARDLLEQAENDERAQKQHEREQAQAQDQARRRKAIERAETAQQQEEIA